MLSMSAYIGTSVVRKRDHLSRKQSRCTGSKDSRLTITFAFQIKKGLQLVANKIWLRLRYSPTE